MNDLGKILVIMGLLITCIGVIFIVSGKLPFSWLGRLPGDFTFRGKGITFYFPLVTSLLISFVLTIILWIINRK